MTRRRNEVVLKHLGTLFNVGTCAGTTDGQLLERFATRRGEGSEHAFAELVGRHGPMVLRACRAIVGNEHDAQDVFQATFLILARTGGSLWVRDSLGPWLHRVACRVAVRARRLDERRRAIERTAAELRRPGDAAAGTDERREELHEQIDRLPERYRTPVVLCDLEGRTYEEAARSLGCPVGTIKSRLARGRERLRDRLGRHNPAPGGKLFLTLPHAPPAPAGIPACLVETTARTAVVFASGGPVSGPAVALARRCVGSMAMTALGRVAFVVLALGIGTGALIGRADAPRAVATASGAETPRSDLDAILGTWVRVSTDGRATDPVVRAMRMLVTKDAERPGASAPAGAGRFVFEWKTGADGRGSTNRVLLDPTRQPKTLDFFPEGKAAPRVCPGIYKLEGDVLTICFRAVEGERPKGFTDTQRNETLDVYERVKP